jgi:glycerophosphoryl diester phosphodiesterase
MGHRGAAGVAPENTLVSFHAAVASGADVLEMDVHATRDGHLVVIHDDTVDRTTDGTGEVRSLTLEELRKLDASAKFVVAVGEAPVAFDGPLRVPTLDEVLGTFPDALFNIELKQEEPPVEAAFLAMLERHGARSRTLIAAEKAPIMRRLRALAPEMTTGMSAEDAFGMLMPVDAATYRSPGYALQVPVTFGDMPIITPDTLARAHALGMELHAWTIDDPAEMEKLLDLGVDGLITNLPHRAAELVKRRRAAT